MYSHAHANIHTILPCHRTYVPTTQDWPYLRMLLLLNAGDAAPLWAGSSNTGEHLIQLPVIAVYLRVC